MAFYANVGYKFKLPASVSPDGGLILCSAMPRPQLERRSINKYAHLVNRVFDPQLYLAGLDPAECPDHCAALASYPWFGVANVPAYESGEQTQAMWRKRVRDQVRANWPGNPLSDPSEIERAVKESIDFQLGLGCQLLIAPAPLTSDPTTDYADEIAWIEAATSYVAGLKGQAVPPLYATVAIADLCLRHTDPLRNTFLDLVADAVSARGVDGVYIVLEQASEASTILPVFLTLCITFS